MTKYELIAVSLITQFNSHLRCLAFKFITHNSSQFPAPSAIPNFPHSILIPIAPQNSGKSCLLVPILQTIRAKQNVFLVCTLSSVTPQLPCCHLVEDKLHSILQNSAVLAQPLVFNGKAIIYSWSNTQNLLSGCSLMQKAGQGQNWMIHKLFTMVIKVGAPSTENPLYKVPKYWREMICLHTVMRKAFPECLLDREI